MTPHQALRRICGKLGIAPDAAWQDLTRAFRRYLQEHHPDRRSADQAQDETIKELNRAYRILREYYRVNGKLPAAPQPVPPPSPPQPDTARAPRPERNSHVSWRGRTPLLLLVALILGPAWWFSAQPPERNDGPSNGPAPGSFNRTGSLPTGSGQPEVPTGERKVRGKLAEGTPASYGIGASKELVRAIEGDPIYETESMWDYGISTVEFKDGRVVGWYSSPLRPLHASDQTP